MDAIAKNVYIEDKYVGVTLGVITQTRGLIQIDAPPSPEDGRTWRASLMGMGNGPERVLINLDAHPDRTLGVRAMDCTVIAHEKTAQAFRNRPNTFKAQGDETGANWEAIPGLGSVRWAPPEISFMEKMTLHWSDTPILLERPEYKGFTIVGSRGGVVTPQVIRTQAEIIKRIYDRVEKLGSKKSAMPAIDKLADQILKDFRVPVAR